MRHSDWESRWSEGRVAFHQPDVSPLLARHAGRVFGDPGPARVLVPLCGKSLDMVFLAERGAEVVGVEYVERAVQEFFAERGLAPKVVGDPPEFRSGPFTLLVDDIFEVGVDRTGPIDAVLDRAALIALDAATRPHYAAHLAALLGPGAGVLLITLDYDQRRMDGPPFAVSHDEVRRLFSADFTVEALEQGDGMDENFRARGLPEIREAAFALTRR